MKMAQQNNTMLVKIQKWGGFLSGMVMPNLGVFVAWGLITALFIPTGWLPNDYFAKLVGPILTYLLPILIGYTAGYNIYGQRGGGIGALATMSVVVGADVTMLSGAMVMGPLAAWIMKKVDAAFKGHVRAGLEMLVSNFSMGIVGGIITLLGYSTIKPVISAIFAFLSAGVTWALSNGVMPLTAIFVAPAQVLFLNNAINHGIMGPLGIEQVKEVGKSILFLVDANCGPSVGTLIGISLFGKGMAKRSAPTAAIIAGIGGIGEVYFPYVLMNPKLVFATMGGIMTSLALFQMLGGGTVATPSPGSFFAMLMLTPKGALLGNLVGFFAGMAVSFVLATILLKLDKSPDEEVGENGLALGSIESSKTIQSDIQLSEIVTSDPIKKIIVACDAGMGSSAMGASVLKNKLRKSMIDVSVSNASVENIPFDADLVITHKKLLSRARTLVNNPKIQFMSITSFVEANQYDDIVAHIKKNNNL
jgi:PTS system mannitol-specific IIC component